MKKQSVVSIEKAMQRLLESQRIPGTSASPMKKKKAKG